jgi:hypothetical protein
MIEAPPAEEVGTNILTNSVLQTKTVVFRVFCFVIFKLFLRLRQKQNYHEIGCKQLLS